MRMVSFSVVSLIAIVPDSECRMPILIVGRLWARGAAPDSMTVAARQAMRYTDFNFIWFAPELDTRR